MYNIKDENHKLPLIHKYILLHLNLININTSGKNSVSDKIFSNLEPCKLNEFSEFQINSSNYEKK